MGQAQGLRELADYLVISGIVPSDINDVFGRNDVQILVQVNQLIDPPTHRIARKFDAMDVAQGLLEEHHETVRAIMMAAP